MGAGREEWRAGNDLKKIIVITQTLSLVKTHVKIKNFLLSVTYSSHTGLLEILV